MKTNKSVTGIAENNQKKGVDFSTKNGGKESI
jgi:hypothetical protein